MIQVFKSSELRIGDTDSIHHPKDGVRSPWDAAIVRNIKDNILYLWRPYGTMADFISTGGVITYIGVEDFTAYADSNTEWLVYARKELK